MKKVLVTGANGHLGMNIVRELVNRNYTVRASVRNAEDPQKSAELRALGVEVVSADLLDRDSLVRATRGIDGVFQVAAGYKLHTQDMERDVWKPAVEGTRNIFEACRMNKVKKVVYTSSVATIGPSYSGEPLDESHWNDTAKEFYAKAKTDSEHLAWELAKEYNIDLVTILPGAIIGPHFKTYTPTTFIFQKILKNELPVKVDVSLAFVDVRDVAVAHVNAYERPEAQGRFIVAGPNYSVNQAYEVAHAFDQNVKIPQMTMPGFMIGLLPVFDWLDHKIKGSMRTITKGVVAEYMTGGKQIFDSSRAQKVLGFKPRPVEESLKDTLVWIRENQIRW